MLRLVAWLLLFAAVGAGYYYYRESAPGAAAPRSLGEAQQSLKDVATTGAVKAALALHASLKPYAVQASTENGIVTLRGAIPSQPLAAAAERVAAAVPDVRQVVNQLKVDPAVAVAAKDSDDERSLGERLDDQALDVQLKLAFSLDRELKDAKLEAHAHKKEVRLSGSVASEPQRTLALRTAGDVPGVRGVIDQLSVGGGADVPAESRRAAVEKALRASASLQRAAIRVRLDDNTVVLEGRVRSSAERELAEVIAKRAAGSGVRNALEVRN